MKKRTPVEAYRMLSSPSNKPIVFVNSRGTPCRIVWDVKYTYKMQCMLKHSPYVIRSGKGGQENLYWVKVYTRPIIC